MIDLNFFETRFPRKFLRQRGGADFYLLLGGVGLLGLILFPYGWLAEMWPLFGRVVDRLFQAEAAHVVGHLVLFAGLGTAVLTLIPRLRRYPALYLGLMGSLGLIQEVLQLVSFKHRPFAGPEWFDLGVDLVGATAVLLLVRRRNGAQMNADKR